jgi:drug/metabolite transporter (DMT)-like permease
MARPVDALILALSALAWAVGSQWTTSRSLGGSALRTVTLQLAAGAVVVGLSSLVAGEWSRWTPLAISGRAALSLVLLVLGGSVLAMLAYTWLLRNTTPALAGSYAFVNPVLALALAWSTGDEVFRWPTLVAGLFVVTSVAIIQRSRATAAPRPAAAAVRLRIVSSDSRSA